VVANQDCRAQSQPQSLIRRLWGFGAATTGKAVAFILFPTTLAHDNSIMENNPNPSSGPDAPDKEKMDQVLFSYKGGSQDYG
jgi:hypothetical protein